jgi:hypothetical protein
LRKDKDKENQKHALGEGERSAHRNVQPVSVLQRQESVSRRLLKAGHQAPIAAVQEGVVMVQYSTIQRLSRSAHTLEYQ